MSALRSVLLKSVAQETPLTELKMQTNRLYPKTPDSESLKRSSESSISTVSQPTLFVHRSLRTIALERGVD